MSGSESAGNDGNEYRLYSIEVMFTLESCSTGSCRVLGSGFLPHRKGMRPLIVAKNSWAT